MHAYNYGLVCVLLYLTYLGKKAAFRTLHHENLLHVREEKVAIVNVRV